MEAGLSAQVDCLVSTVRGGSRWPVRWAMCLRSRGPGKIVAGCCVAAVIVTAAAGCVLISGPHVVTTSSGLRGWSCSDRTTSCLAFGHACARAAQLQSGLSREELGVDAGLAGGLVRNFLAVWRDDKRTFGSVAARALVATDMALRRSSPGVPPQFGTPVSCSDRSPDGGGSEAVVCLDPAAGSLRTWLDDVATFAGPTSRTAGCVCWAALSYVLMKCCTIGPPAQCSDGS